MKYFIANWKARKTYAQSIHWIHQFYHLLEQNTRVQAALENKEISVIICPAAPFLISLEQQREHTLGIYWGVQDISFKTEGSYTGEIPATMYQDIAHYAIIGHSERRNYFSETELLIKTKIALAIQAQLQPILCIRSPDDIFYPEVPMVAYEHTNAIGTGNNVPVEEVLNFKSQLSLTTSHKFIYGGSVTGQNSNIYLDTDQIDGLLIGGASLDPNTFFTLVAQFVAKRP
ncbi:triosephosphate isomerase [Candidatus Roizmanbacteria bacterium]|nr:triosephosphate isomerase [Candidatus Roizmanbacteria bacterium]